jgi:ankyrin repeat protein
VNQLIRALKALDATAVTSLLDKDPKWLTWREASGRNALHYLGAVVVGDDASKAAASVAIASLLLDRGMDIDSVHEIPDEGAVFSATPIWHAYARGRNQALYTFLLERGASPQDCMFAIAWNDDVAAAELFKRYGADIDPRFGTETPFLAAYLWRRFKVAEWFLANGASVDEPDAAGNTALYHAVRRRYDAAQVELLLRYGADPRRRNREGVSPLDLATQNRLRKLRALMTEQLATGNWQLGGRSPTTSS